MELYEIKNGLEDARLLLDQLYVSANIEVLKREIEGLTVQTMDEHFWDDQAHATKVYAHLNEMKKVADTDDSLEASYKELVEVYEYVKDTEDSDFMASLDEDYIQFPKQRKRRFHFPSLIILNSKRISMNLKRHYYLIRNMIILMRL